MPIPDNQKQYVEIVMHGLIDAGGSDAIPTVNTFHFRRTALTGTITKTPIDTAFQAAIADKIVLAMSVRWNQQRNEVRFINDALDPFVKFTHANAGARAGIAMPSHSAVMILLNSGFRGRSYQGKKFFGPIDEDDTTVGDDDVLNAAAITRFNTVMTDWLAGFTDSNGQIWVPAILSRTLSSLSTNPTVVGATDVVSMAINKRVTSLKGRKVKSVY